MRMRVCRGRISAPRAPRAKRVAEGIRLVRARGHALPTKEEIRCLSWARFLQDCHLDIEEEKLQRIYTHTHTYIYIFLRE